MRWFPLALLLGACFAAAQNTPPAATADPGQKIRVEGTVLSLNGDLVRKATVRLQGSSGQPGQPPGGYSEITDKAGKFVFEDIAPGHYTLTADKQGFVDARVGTGSNRYASSQINLTAGMETKDLVIKMTPQGVIAGKVVDQDGDPVVSAQVQAMRSGYNRGRKQLQPTGGATTNDLGEYRLINLSPGLYFVSASDLRATRFSQDSDPRKGKDQESSITTFYPNASDASNAVGVDVAAGSEMRGMDIRLLQAKVYTVRGKAADAPGVPAVLSLARKNDNANVPGPLNGGGSTQLRPDGTFEFHNILPGTYVLQLMQVVSVNGNQPASLAGRVDVTVGSANVDGLVLPLIPRPEIAGTVKLEDGDIAALIKPPQAKPGAASAGNATFTPQTRLWLNLIQTENGPVGGSTTQLNGDGTFRFTNLGLGKYALNMASMPGTYLKSARFGGQEVLHASIDTTSGAGGTLELVLSSKVATITGSVQSEKSEAMAGAMVTLWAKTPDASPSGGAQLVATDQNGAFKFQDLAPGDYYIAAWEQLEPGLGTSTDFLNHFTSEASSITLAEGGQESKDLKPVAADKVAAEVAKLQ